MSEFMQYQKKSVYELRPFKVGEILDERTWISETDRSNGSPKIGDMIARNPSLHDDQWLIAEADFKENFEAVVLDGFAVIA